MRARRGRCKVCKIEERGEVSKGMDSGGVRGSATNTNTRLPEREGGLISTDSFDEDSHRTCLLSQ